MVRYVRVKSTPGRDMTSQFTSSLSAPINVNKDCKIALKSLCMRGLNNSRIFVGPGTSFKASPTTGVEKLITIPPGSYTRITLVNTLTTLLNESLDPVTDFANPEILGFEWRCSIVNNTLAISFNRTANNPAAAFNKSTNVNVNTPQGGVPTYQRTDATVDDNAYINSTLPLNRGCAQQTLILTGATINSGFYYGWSNKNGTVRTNASVSSYIYGVGTNPDEENKIYIIENGAFTDAILTDDDAPLTPDLFNSIRFYHEGNILMAFFVNSQAAQVASAVIKNKPDLYTDYYTQLTFRTNDFLAKYVYYFDTPFVELNNGNLVDNTIYTGIITQVGIIQSTVQLTFPAIASDILGFTENPLLITASKGTFIASQKLEFVKSTNIVVEILSLSQLEGYQAGIGLQYKAPILYVFDTLSIDDVGNIYAEIDYPVFVSLKNSSTIPISQFVIRISADGQDIYTIQDYTSLTILIDDGV
jgi:hypothetical protein